MKKQRQLEAVAVFLLLAAGRPAVLVLEELNIGT